MTVVTGIVNKVKTSAAKNQVFGIAFKNIQFAWRYIHVYVEMYCIICIIYKYVAGNDWL